MIPRKSKYKERIEQQQRDLDIKTLYSQFLIEYLKLYQTTKNPEYLDMIKYIKEKRTELESFRNEIITN